MDYKNFISMLARKRDLLNSVLEIASNQNELINNDNIEMLVHAIDMRKKYLEEVSSIDKEFSLNNHLEFFDTTSEINILQEEIAAIINDILKLDHANCKKAEQKLQEYKKEFSNLKHDNKRLKLYKSAGTQLDSVYIDTKK